MLGLIMYGKKRVHWNNQIYMMMYDDVCISGIICLHNVDKINIFIYKIEFIVYLIRLSWNDVEISCHLNCKKLLLE
jgi:hypothetical protein